MSVYETLAGPNRHSNTFLNSAASQSSEEKDNF